MSGPSIKSLAQLALGGSQLFLGSDQSILQNACPNPQVSCQTGHHFVNPTCCMSSPGGQFALTQFWNSDASRGPPGYLGPLESWTIHGLWPDHCDGRYDSVCDCSRSGDCSRQNRKCSRAVCNREYSSITRILQDFGEDEVLSFMHQNWKGIQGDEHLWQHEWSKHGTCVNTLSPECYTNYRATEEVVDYFKRAIEVFKTLPSYDWLAQAGIVPSYEATYDLEDIKAALNQTRGVSAVVGCSGYELREIWYHFVVRGSVKDGQFVASEPNFTGSSGPGKGCPPTGIKYLPKDRF